MAMLVAHPFVLLFDQYRRKAHYFIAKTWATLTVTPFFKIKYEGLENLPPPDVPAVYVSNHQSFLDIYTLLTLGRSFKFISKTSIFLYPIIGWAMFLLGVIPLKRMDSRSQLVILFFFHIVSYCSCVHLVCLGWMAMYHGSVIIKSFLSSG
jgi:1-acyl-sn-glycerol-3-phosphate acyltransferase